MSSPPPARRPPHPGSLALPQAPAHARSIRQSHARSAALGVDAAAAPELSPVPMSSLRESRERQRRLFEHAAPVMETLFDQIVFARSVVVLTDAQGTILHSIGDDGFMEKAQQVALAPGMNWSEAAKGTNAIGTALFDEAATLVHGQEHYVRANHFLTCSASPIFDHAGQLMGVLDVTGDQRSYHPHTLAMVSMSAQMIENQWFTDHFRLGLRLHFHPRAEGLGTMREGMVAVSPDGAILGANRNALTLLGASAAALRIQGLEAVFGVSVGHIVDHCRRFGDQPMAVQAGERGQAMPGVFVRAYFNWPTLWPAALAEANGAGSVGVGGTKVQSERPATRVQQAASVVGGGTTLQDIEYDTIRRAVDAAGGNISQAARALGIGRNTVYRKLRRKE